MKKLFILFAACMIAANMMAEGHMKFKGVEMKGTPQEFAEELEDKGFTLSNINSDTPILNGDFAGYKQCRVVVGGIKNTVVTDVQVSFPYRRTWQDMYDNYTQLKEMLTSKYGEPASDIEDWHGRRYSDDLHKLQALRENRVTIMTQFNTPEGKIELFVMSEYNLFFVVLKYFDAINQKVAHNNAIDDL